MLFLSSFCFLVRRKLRLKHRKGLDALFSWFFKLHVCMVCWKLFSQLFQPGVTARAKGCTRFSSMNCGCDGLPWSGLGHCPSKTHQEACSYRRMFDIHFSVWRVQINYFCVPCCYFNLSKSFPVRPTGAAPDGSSDMSLRVGWRKGSFEVKDNG